MIGTTIGKYRIVGLLGRGATGIVYKAIDDTLDREVAIKILNPHFTAADIMKRFRAEATTLAKLSHPEIATIHELLRTDTDLLMVMELVRGETLEILSERAGPMPPDLAGYLLDGILSALEHAHRAGIVHRDLKPANIMVTQSGGIKIMDFGIARVRGAEHMTADGCAVGTPAYMAPEQVLGEEIDGRTDLYAVGVILYRLLAARLPFDADTPMAMLQKHIAETPEPLHLHRQGLPDWCQTIVARALAKSPADRFQTADEFRGAVARAIGLGRSIDLAKAFAVSAEEIASTITEPAPVETVAITRTPAKPQKERTATIAAGKRARSRAPSSLAASVGRMRLPAAVARILRPVKRLPLGRQGAAVLAAVAAVAIVAYLASVASAVDSGAGASASRTRGAAAAPSREVVSSASKTVPPAPERSASGAVTAAQPLVFQTKILVRPGRVQREEDARLSLSRGRVSVTPYGTSDEPVFAALYETITAIHYSRGPAWKPPQKLKKVIRLGDDVLDRIGIRGRHEISLFTDDDDRFIVLRVEERVASRLLKELKERTGRSPEAVAER